MFAAATFLPTFLTAPSPSSWTLPASLQSLLELFPPFVLAVPKKKTSHSRKAMRSANKGLKDKHNIVHCPACGSAKLAHHLCSNCYSQLSRGWKAEQRQSAEGVSP
ncbi:ribosomal L32p protein family-domain-containing protein [Irpex rosettiformis]|uniref:Ribosomal L32p protein family-domain-containing protein n=1 Tax=Irpex rosettiformis TaxID=378272 RepID=A0ACB8UKC2_9APHY|nr:ribosomal L32p protein family-domain-containing protein [Irpex rosettiformis]